MKKLSKKEKKGLIIFLMALLGLSIVYFINETKVPTHKPFHIHSDFKVYLNGSFIDFSEDKYMSSQENQMSKFVHLHDNDGEVIHFHARHVSLGEFFLSIGVNYTSNCFENFCSNGNNSLKMYVNGVENLELSDYVVNDLDQILIYYGSNQEVSNLFTNITDKSCIQSGLCPERGEPSDSFTCVVSDDASGGCLG